MKSKNRVAKQWMIYFLIAIPMTFLLRQVVEHQIEIVFWIYIATMGIGGLILGWNRGASVKSKFIEVLEHICFVCVIALFLWGAVDYFLGQ
ncbi:MAG: hypothetical protein AAF985_12650 [Bacteroidota bacterium]